MTKKKETKNFDFEKFFTGKVVATGYMCFFYPKIRKKKLKVIFKGAFENKKLKLIEEYFEDNLKTIREWEFEKVDKNKFFGNGKNIVNPFELHIKDNFLEMNYFSERKMGDFAMGLIESSMEYFGEKGTIDMNPKNDSGSEVQFIIKKL